MSREYMENLQDLTFVANAVLQQIRIRKMMDLQIEPYRTYAYEYVHALITEEYNRNKASTPLMASLGYSTLTLTPASTSRFIEDRRRRLSAIITEDSDMKALRDKAIDIAKVSLEVS